MVLASGAPRESARGAPGGVASSEGEQRQPAPSTAVVPWKLSPARSTFTAKIALATTPAAFVAVVTNYGITSSAECDAAVDAVTHIVDRAMDGSGITSLASKLNSSAAPDYVVGSVDEPGSVDSAMRCATEVKRLKHIGFVNPGTRCYANSTHQVRCAARSRVPCPTPSAGRGGGGSRAARAVPFWRAQRTAQRAARRLVRGNARCPGGAAPWPWLWP